MVAAASVIVLLTGCSRPLPKTGSATSSATTDTVPTSAPGDPTTRAHREPLSRQQLTEARTLLSDFAAKLVVDSPALAGVKLDHIAPVFDEDTIQPVGAMAHLALPRVVSSVAVDLIRSRAGTPEIVESEIFNLVALDAIVLFSTGKVVTLAVSPAASFAADPATATVVRPISPEARRSPEFGSTD